MKKINTLFSIILIFIILLSLAPKTEVYATYDSDKFVSIAQNEIGTNSGTKYRTWFYGNDKSVAWCAIFVSWCANQAGIPTYIIPKSASCVGLYNGILSGGGEVVSSPQKGDLVFYKIGSLYVHVGIMEDSITSVQGNLSGKVKSINPSNYYNKGQSYTMTYVRPNYLETSSQLSQAITDVATEVTNKSACLNGRFQSSCKVHITEHGAYMGTDPNNMSLVARDIVNYNRSSLTMFYRTSKYYGDLLPGTTYYYKQYVIADDKTYWGEVRSFTTDGKVSCSISGEAYNISDKSASLRITTSLSSPGDIIISALRFGTSPDALHTLEQININQHTDQHVLERDLSEYNLTIEPNKTYYFAASVVVNGRVNVSDIFRFTTSAVIPEDTSEGGPDEEIIPPPEAPIITLSSNTIYVGQTATVQWNSVPNSNHYSLIVSGPVSVISEMNGNETWSELSDLTEGTYSINVWASGVGGSSPKSNTLTLTVLPAVITHHVFTKPATNITATSAQFNGSFSSDAKPHMTEHGVYMGTDPVTMEKVAVDKVDYYKSSLTMFYSTSKYYGTLMPDTTYYYCEYVVVDGVELRGETLSFKTSPPSGNIRYGVVHVNSGALAINDAPRASNNGSNPSKQIGRIPNGQTCIVDLSRTSGNWYWVTYNGVSGYAYKSYISLQ